MTRKYPVGVELFIKVGVAASVFAIPAARAQTTPATPPVAPPKSTVGSILGVATDSLHGGFLSEAVVTVVEKPAKSAMTSERGAFRIDSLPPGDYTLELSHPVLDSLRIRVVSVPVRVAAGEVGTVTLSVPTGETIVNNVCTPLHRHLGPNAILGQVLDADADQPVSGAEVSIAWVETVVDPVRGVITGPRVRRDTTSADGSFRLCGLPAGLAGTLQASRGIAQTAELAVRTGDAPVTLQTLRVASKAPEVVIADSSARVANATGASVRRLVTGPATVTGTVTNRGGVPVPGAHVSVPGSTAQTMSRDDGTFALSGVPLGTQLVQVRRVGYDAVSLPLDVSTRGPNTLIARLAQADVPQLTPVTVEQKRVNASVLASTGFDQRRKMGIGKYLTEADLEKYQPSLTSDALRYIPGLYVLGSGQNVSLYSTRDNGCVRYLIDNQSMDDRGGTIDEMVPPTEVLGVEYYQAGQVPLKLERARTSGCALLVIWTRRAVKEQAGKSGN